MRKNLLTPAEIEAGNFSPKTKRTYLYRWNRSLRMKSIQDEKRELRQRLKEKAHLPIQEIADLLEITKRSVIQIAYRARIDLAYGRSSPKKRGEGISPERETKIHQPKIKPVKEKKGKVKQVVKKEKTIKQRGGKVAKIKEEVLESRVRDYTGMKMVMLGIRGISFYVPQNATQEEIEAERQKRLNKYQFNLKSA